MTDAWSISEGYWDVEGSWHETPRKTRAVLRATMGPDGADEPPPAPPSWFVHTGEAPALLGPCDVVLEDGAVLHDLRSIPPDLPIGYHELQPLDGSSASWLVVSPRRCPLPAPGWGWAVQLYAARSSRSWGIGDLADLRDLASGHSASAPASR